MVSYYTKTCNHLLKYVSLKILFTSDQLLATPNTRSQRPSAEPSLVPMGPKLPPCLWTCKPPVPPQLGPGWENPPYVDDVSGKTHGFLYFFLVYWNMYDIYIYICCKSMVWLRWVNCIENVRMRIGFCRCVPSLSSRLWHSWLSYSACRPEEIWWATPSEKD